MSEDLLKTLWSLSQSGPSLSAEVRRHFRNAYDRIAELETKNKELAGLLAEVKHSEMEGFPWTVELYTEGDESDWVKSRDEALAELEADDG